MKVYVASIECENFEKRGVGVAEKTQQTIKTLATIQRHARDKVGKDAIVIVVLQEYAFTPVAVPAADKNASLAALQAAVKSFKNMILIPGSYASYEDFHNEKRREQKTSKLLANYRSLSKSNLVPLFEFADEEDDVVKKSQSGELKHSVFMQNCAYILTANSKTKHKKCTPWYETDKLDDAIENGIYYIGADHPVKTIKVNQKQFKLGLLICREHEGFKPEAFTSQKSNPLVQVIVSDSIPTDLNKLFGALNIHFDSQRGLSIYVNRAHHQANVVTEVQGGSFKIIDNNTCYHDAIATKYIDTAIPLKKNDTHKPTLAAKLFSRKRKVDDVKTDTNERVSKAYKF